MVVFITDCLFSGFNFEIIGCIDSILVVSESMPIDSPDSFFELKDSNLFEVIVVEDSISAQVYVITKLFGLFKKFYAINVVIQFLCSKYQGTFCIILINFSKSTAHFLWEQLRTHISEIIDQGFGS